MPGSVGNNGKDGIQGVPGERGQPVSDSVCLL